MAETILRLRSRTPDIATLKPSRAMPNSSLRRKYDATFALWMMFLLGRHAMFGHDPPTYLRSMTATRCPRPAKVHAATVDPVPPPRITRSNSSGWVFLSTWVDMRCSSHVFWRSGEPDLFHDSPLSQKTNFRASGSCRRRRRGAATKAPTRVAPIGYRERRCVVAMISREPLKSTLSLAKTRWRRL